MSTMSPLIIHLRYLTFLLFYGNFIQQHWAMSNERWACNITCRPGAIQRSVEVHTEQSVDAKLFWFFDFVAGSEIWHWNSIAVCSQLLRIQSLCVPGCVLIHSWMQQGTSTFIRYNYAIHSMICIKHLNNFSFQQNRIRHSSYINFNLIIHLSNNYVHVRSITWEKLRI